MWGRAFLVLTLLLAGAPPPPLLGKASRGGSRSGIIAADAQISQSGSAYAVKCVRRCEQRSRSSPRRAGGRIRAPAAQLALARRIATLLRATSSLERARGKRRRRRELRASKLRASKLRRADCVACARSAEQRLGFAQSSFVPWEFQQTVAGYFGIDPLLVVIVSVFPGGAAITVVRYVVRARAHHGYRGPACAC